MLSTGSMRANSWRTASASPRRGLVQQHMHLRQFNGRHGAAGAASEFVSDVAPTRPTQHAAQRVRRAPQHLGQPLPARQGLFLDVLDGWDGGEDLQQYRRHRAPAPAGGTFCSMIGVPGTAAAMDWK